MNSGAEAVETAIKASRKWGYDVKGGVIIPPKGYLKGLREICDQNRVRLVLDEIQSGLGRTGKLFAF